MNRPRPHRAPVFAAVLACLPLSCLATSAAAQDFTEDARFELRLSAFNPEANIRFAGDGVATDGEQTEDLAASGGIDADGRWRPRGELAFNMSPRQSLRTCTRPPALTECSAFAIRFDKTCCTR